MSASVLNEQVVFEDGGVQVTKTLARVGGKSFPVNGIGSVFVAVPRRGSLYMYSFGAAFTAIIAFVSDNSSGVIPGVAAVISVVCLLAALAKPHTLVIRTASGDQQALQSKDAAFLASIQRAIEEAVALRG